MKIGIITLPLHTNYGGILQAYALQNVLQRMGHHVTILDYQKNKYKPWIMPLAYIKRFILRYIKGKKYIFIFAEQKARKEYPIIAQHTEKFIKKNINRKHIKSFNVLKNKDFDAFVVGSDQIWRPIYFYHIKEAYLHFTKEWNVKRISYAASFGTESKEYSPKQIIQCKKLLNQFNAISVREESGKNLCMNYFNKQAVQVLDPTMLLSTADYEAIIQDDSNDKRNGILTYILDSTPQKQKIIYIVSKELRTEAFAVNNIKVENCLVNLSERIAPPVESWVKGFKECDFVITDSFHSCIYAILFNKPFIIIGNTQRGLTRFHSLLSTFGLNNRILLSEEDLPNIINSTIDWDKVNTILDIKRNESLDFLKKALTNS